MAIKSVTIEFRETNDFMWKHVKPCENNIGESRWPHKPTALQGSHPGRGGVVAMSGNFSWMFHWWQIITKLPHNDHYICVGQLCGSLPSKRRPNMSQLVVVPITRAQAIAENCLKRLKEDELHRTPISFGATLLIWRWYYYIYISIYSTIVGLVSIMMCTYVHYTRMICFNRLFGLAMSW